MTTAGLLTLRARLEPTRATLVAPGAQQRDPIRRPARVAQMLALAHRIEREIASGVVADRGEAAARLGLTAPRVSQLCDLLVLAPDIQEQILFLESVDGVEPLTERALRPLTKEPRWDVQRGFFARCRRSPRR